MPWDVVLRSSVIDDLRWFGRKEGRRVLEAARERLSADPTEESRNMKTLRSNPFAQRELRLLGKYRILFDVDAGKRLVTIVVAGEKKGARLVVRGKEFEEHHEDSPPE